MLRLPSGQLVGIVSERARQHAQQKQLQVSDSTPRQQLYPLVDIVFPPEGRQALPHKSFVFTGYTLADRHWLARWPHADREQFLEWLEQAPQRQEIERARLRLTCRALPARCHHSDYPQRLYSSLQRRLRNIRTARAGARQWKQTLLNLQKTGLRAEELEWSGLLLFLDQCIELDRNVTREELLQRIDFSDIRLELHNEMERRGGCGLAFVEQAQRLDALQLTRAGLTLADDELALQRFVEPLRGYRIGSVRRRGSADAPRWFVLGTDGSALAGPDAPLLASREQAEMLAGEHACQLCASRGELGWSQTYDYLSLHGGEAYREWLVTLPDYAGSYFGGHYYDRNVLLHIRTKLRRCSDGRRLLFIEEIQSDWHQAAHRFGYENHWGGQIAVAPFRKEWVGLGLKLMLLHAVEQGIDAIGWAAGGLHQLRYGRELRSVQRLYDQEIPRVLQQLGRQWHGTVADAHIETRQPWLQAVRVKQRWRVSDPQGRFRTQPRYSLAEAHRLMTRHSKKTQLNVPVFDIPKPMAAWIKEHGLPLFGEMLESLG